MLVLRLGEVANKHIEYHLMAPYQIYCRMVLPTIPSYTDRLCWPPGWASKIRMACLPMTVAILFPVRSVSMLEIHGDTELSNMESFNPVSYTHLHCK